MNSTSLHPADTAPVPIPRWLHVFCTATLTALLGVIVWLVLAFVMAGPQESLAGVALILAGLLAVPFLAALLLWTAGYVMRTRSPRVALGFVITSAIIGGLGVLTIGVWYLPQI